MPCSLKLARNQLISKLIIVTSVYRGVSATAILSAHGSCLLPALPLARDELLDGLLDVAVGVNDGRAVDFRVLKAHVGELDEHLVPVVVPCFWFWLWLWLWLWLDLDTLRLWCWFWLDLDTLRLWDRAGEKEIGGLLDVTIRRGKGRLGSARSETHGDKALDERPSGEIVEVLGGLSGGLGSLLLKLRIPSGESGVHSLGLALGFGMCLSLSHSRSLGL